ncbi:hypothetical protein ACJX0J_023397, partial [Zea mays]
PTAVGVFQQNITFHYRDNYTYTILKAPRHEDLLHFLGHFIHVLPLLLKGRLSEDNAQFYAAEIDGVAHDILYLGNLDIMQGILQIEKVYGRMRDLRLEKVHFMLIIVSDKSPYWHKIFSPLIHREGFSNERQANIAMEIKNVNPSNQIIGILAAIISIKKGILWTFIWVANQEIKMADSMNSTTQFLISAHYGMALCIIFLCCFFAMLELIISSLSRFNFSYGFIAPFIVNLLSEWAVYIKLLGGAYGGIVGLFLCNLYLFLAQDLTNHLVIYLKLGLIHVTSVLLA